jgi:hypothetical protein
MKMAEIRRLDGARSPGHRVFETDKALSDFINSGWEFGGQATAAAKSADKGSAYQGALAVTPGVWIYQVTEKAWRSSSPPRGPSTTRTVI